MSEAWLRLKQGNHDAFEAIYRDHIRLVYAYALRRCQSLADVEDVVAHCFTELWRQRAYVEPDEERGFLPWLFTVAARRIRWQREQDVQQRNLSASTVSSGGSRVAVAESCDASLLDVIQVTIANADPEDQQIARLAWEYGLTSHEIEQRTGIRASTVRGRLQRLRGRIRDARDKGLGRD